MKRQILFTMGFLGLVLLLSPSLLSAQISEETDIVLFSKNGSVYKGRLISETAGFFKIEILENQTIIISKDEIKKVQRGTDYLFFRKGRKHKLFGFFWGIHGGVNVQTPITREDYAVQLQLLLGYHVDSKLTLGLSFDLALNETLIANLWLTKAYFTPSLYGRYYFNHNQIRPFAYSQIGYGIGLEIAEVDPLHGFTMQNGVGIHLASKRRTKLVLTVGHYLQRMKGSGRFFDNFNNEVQVEYRLWLSQPMFKIGIEVN